MDAQSKKIVRDYAKVMFDMGVQKCRTHYRMPDDWNPKFSVRFDKDISMANAYQVNIGLNFENSFKGGYFHSPEYEHIKDDPIIGSFKTKDWRVFVKTLIAHELAHSVDMYKDPSIVFRTAYKKSNFDGKHGRTWQQKYKWILTKGFSDGTRLPIKGYI